MSIFPFLDEEEAEEIEYDTDTVELPVFKEYAYDYETNGMLLNEDGVPYLVEQDEALKIWIHKALHTVRYRYLAYSDDYGSELESLISYATEEDIIFREAERFITEALMGNPYIAQVSDFSFTMSGDVLSGSFCCTTIYGSMEIDFDWRDEDGV